MPVARPVLLALLPCLLLPLAGRARAAAGAPDYAVAITPMTPPTDIKRRWQPLLDQLERDTGLHFHFRFYEDNTSFSRGLQRNEADFAMMGPAQLWRVHTRYRPILRDTGVLVGLLAVRRNSPMQRLGDLDGKRIAVPGGPAFSGSSSLQQALHEQGTTPEFVPMNTQSTGFRSLMLGKVDAAAGTNYGLKLLPAEILQQIRIVFRSPALPPPAFTAAATTREEDVLKVKAALLHMRETHPQLLESALMPDITEADFERDYAPMGQVLEKEAGNGPH